MPYSETIKFIVAMIIMLNPFGSLSIFLDLTKQANIIRQRKIARVTTLTIIIIMLLTLWTGKALLEILGITIPSFRFAGGIILLLIGLSMLQAHESPLNHTEEDDQAAKERHSIAIVPLALPVIIGPGAMTTLIIAAGDYPHLLSRVWISIICTVLGLMMGTVLYFGGSIAKFVGMSVIMVVTRIMGMIVMAIAVGMLADGIMGLFPMLH